MKRIVIALAIIAVANISLAQTNTYRINSYYPSPYGAYAQLKLIPRSAMASPCDYGQLYVNSDQNNALYLCMELNGAPGGEWGPAPGPWTQFGDNIYPSDTSTNSDLKVVIGSTTPVFKLTLDVDGGLLAEGAFAEGEVLPVLGIAPHMVWYPRRSAFRAGYGNHSDGSIGDYSTITGGSLNVASGDYTTVAGGQLNNASEDYATILGGQQNTANEVYTTASGGLQNIVSGEYATVAGGQQNTASGDYSFIGGGHMNSAISLGSVVGGGQQNNATGSYAYIGGGHMNIAGGNHSVIVGGRQNTASGPYSVVGGGHINSASGSYSIVAGGLQNEASDDYAFVGGGHMNIASGFASVVVGGEQNLASGDYSVLAGGHLNSVSGDYSVTYGGEHNSNAGDYSFVGGYNMNLTASADRTFLWGYSAVPVFVNTPDAFIIYSANLGINTAAPAHPLELSSGARIQADGNVCTGSGECLNTYSDIRFKENIKGIQNAYSKLAKLKGVTFRWIDPEKDKKEKKQIGFIAQEVEKDFPDWVSTYGDGFKHIDLDEFKPLAVEALKELDTEIDGLLAGYEQSLKNIEEYKKQIEQHAKDLKIKDAKIKEQTKRIEQLKTGQKSL